MLAVDVNVLVSAFRDDAPDHQQMKSWLEHAVNTAEPLGISDAVLCGTIRLLTHPRVFDVPTPLEVALAQVQTLRSHAGTHVLVPGSGYWPAFVQLCTEAKAVGNLAADAAHAALAVEHGATWVSKDRDFARFPGLRWRHPLD